MGQRCRHACVATCSWLYSARRLALFTHAGEYALKDLQALIELHKYRALRQRYQE